MPKKVVLSVRSNQSYGQEGREGQRGERVKRNHKASLCIKLMELFSCSGLFFHYYIDHDIYCKYIKKHFTGILSIKIVADMGRCLAVYRNCT